MPHFVICKMESSLLLPPEAMVRARWGAHTAEGSEQCLAHREHSASVRLSVLSMHQEASPASWEVVVPSQPETTETPVVDGPYAE